ncbi:class I SAM-dependent methyltransferase [Nonomuraea angiospora]|uniref:class I SAM-dependent methyltransferase n=1 Tax=Nonomuraea angiospora TaxID=46172 RepID=UPI00361C939E
MKASELTQFVADAHEISLPDGSVDAVIAQAVLEHVPDPWLVVSEIHRVLRLDGVVYAETPFMQQVHEGAYDFCRFTESGRRRLFRNFTQIDSGPIGGPGLQAVRNTDFFLCGMLRSNPAGSTTRRFTKPVFTYLDRFVPRRCKTTPPRVPISLDGVRTRAWRPGTWLRTTGVHRHRVLYTE